MDTRISCRRILLLAALTALFSALPNAAAAAPALVKHLGSNANMTSGTSINITLGAGVTVAVGNTVVIAVAMDPSTATVTATDSGSNSYSADASVANGSGTSGIRTVVLSAPVTTGLVATNTVTVSFSSAVVAKAISVHEFSGLMASGRVDQTKTGTGTTQAVTTGNAAATTQADELLFGAFAEEDKSNNPFGTVGATTGTGYTILTIGSTGTSGGTASHATVLPIYKIVTATGSYAADGTRSVSGTPWSGALVTYKSKCGNGTTESGEQCDDGNTATGDCCSASCQFESAVTVCRSAANDCDVAETCTGASAVCPTNVLKSAGATCGSTSDTVCDNPDTCNGSGNCLANNEPITTLCRADAGDCDVAEFCNGSGSCPTNGFDPTGTACGSASDTVCDNPDTCNSTGSCLANLEPSTTTCRGAAGECDAAELCDGAGACPADVFASAGTACGDSGEGLCDNPDTCNGSGVCNPNHEPASTVCRPDAGECDVADSCDGAGACAADSFEPAGTSCGDASDTLCDNPDTCNASGSCVANFEPSTAECRGAAGECDVAETCDGAGACPADAFAAAGAACGNPSATVCDRADTCDGSGICVDNFEPSTTECRADAGECDVAELCDGAGTCPGDSFAPAGTACGDSGEGLCDKPDTCDGSGTCDPNFEPTTTECRSDAGECDVPESCDGAGACPADAFEPAGTSCGSAADTVCDDPDTCSAFGGCFDNFEPSTTECRGAAGECDVAESCDGTGACPADSFEPAGTACGDSSDTVCDDPDACDAAGSCLANHAAATTECRADAGDCDVAETCDGAGACPADAFEAAGTSCGSASDSVCDNPDTCDASGSCLVNHEPATTECRADAGDCDVAESCDGTGACPADAFEPAGTSCGGLADTACDNPDTCDASGGCLTNFEPTTTECRADAGDCDVAENCDGAGACPSDSFEPAGTACGSASDTVCDKPDGCDAAGACLPNHEPATTECRADAGDCDVVENCDGAGACPADAFEPADTACGDASDTDCDNPDSCDAAGVCLPNFAPAATECRPDAGECDVPESCDGAGACPADAFEPLGTTCGDGAESICDHPDSCDASGTCTPNFEPSTTTCRPDAGECDIVENCDGGGACPADTFAPAGAACGDASDTVCDNPDTCDAAGACHANHEPTTTTCRPDAGDCDIVESCDGAGACPADVLEPAGTACGSASDTVCDGPDTCDGTGACAPNFAPSSTPCRAAAGDCDVAESCSGSSATCPADGVLDAGMSCRDASSSCDAAALCDGVSGDCPANEPAPDGSDCDDGDPCTGPDVCQSGACTGTLDPDLCVDNRLCYKTSFSGFISLPVMTLIDFETIGAEVGAPAEFCTAADRDGEGVGEPGIHLVAYKIGTTDGWPKHSPRTLVMHNDLGDISLDTVKPEYLLVPSAEDPSSDPPAPDFQSHGVDHYKCYKAKLTKGTLGLAKGTTVTVADMFSTTRTVALKKPKHVCTPVDREGDGVKSSEAYLVCYQGKPAKGQPKHSPRSGLHVVNPQSDLLASTVKEAEVCVPSTLVP